MDIKVSVILSTYNGEKYVVEQMESIRNQTRIADELIICDDCSNDNTCDIVQNYIKRNNLYNWKFYRNSSNKGFKKNFLDGAELTTGDLLFYSDQDDVWNKEKISHMVKAIIEKNALAVYCLTNTIDAKGMYQKNQIDKINRISCKENIRKVTLCEKIKYARSPGLCLAFKRELLEEVRYISMKYDLPHDIPVGTVAAVKGKYYVINEPLVDHRVHLKNVSTPETKIWNSFKNIDKQIVSREMKLRELIAINDIYKVVLSEKNKCILDEAINLTRSTIECLKNRKTKGLYRAIFTNNNMINYKLAIRNLLSIIYYKINGEI